MLVCAGGHGTIYPHTTLTGALCKPITDARGEVELAFYAAVFSPARCALPPATLMPRYLGTLPAAERGGAGTAATGAGAAATGAAATGAGAALVLADLTAGLARPCVMDVKMGVQSWDGAADAAKRAREGAKWPAQARLGLRFTGMVVQGAGGAQQRYDRAFCHSLPCEGDEGPRLALQAFLAEGGGALRRAVAAALLARLEKIVEWFAVQREFHFYASSLLLVYEGAGDAPAARADVRMIDFAHVQAAPADGAAAASGRDEGYLTGLHTLVRCLQGMLTAPAPP
jgi:hypothetical protein